MLPLLSYYQAGYYYTLHIETVALAVFTVYSFTRTGLMLYQVLFFLNGCGVGFVYLIL